MPSHTLPLPELRQGRHEVTRSSRAGPHPDADMTNQCVPRSYSISARNQCTSAAGTEWTDRAARRVELERVVGAGRRRAGPGVESAERFDLRELGGEARCGGATA